MRKKQVVLCMFCSIHLRILSSECFMKIYENTINGLRPESTVPVFKLRTRLFLIFLYKIKYYLALLDVLLRVTFLFCYVLFLAIEYYRRSQLNQSNNHHPKERPNQILRNICCLFACSVVGILTKIKFQWFGWLVCGF